jgi:drug/metabolite transporter (DMT)-like permease
MTRFRISPALVYMALAVFLYALSNVFVKLLAHVPSMEIVFFRALISLLLGFLLMKKYRIRLLGTHKKFLLSRAFFSSLALIFSYASLPHLPLATTAVIGYLSPIFIAILAFVILKESIHPLQWLLFIFTFSGIFLIKGFDPNIPLPYFVLGLFSILFSACGYITIRRARQSEHPLTIVFYTSAVSIGLSIGFLSVNWSVGTIQWHEWVYLLANAILTQAAQLLMIKAYQMEDAVKISNLNYTSIIYALILGYLFFGETLNVATCLGMFVVLTGVFLNVNFQQIRQYLRSVRRAKVFR